MNDPNLICLQSRYKDLMRQESDAWWSGKIDEAKALTKQIHAVMARLDNGEVYEVLF